MGVGAPTTDTPRVIRLRGIHSMEAVIVIFLLLFAVLAFGWFYLQRAKARTAGDSTTKPDSTDTPAAS
jgi:hypothetical protein